MTKPNKRLLVSFLAALLVPLLFLLGGFDFDQRGEAACMCALFTLSVFALSYNYPD